MLHQSVEPTRDKRARTFLLIAFAALAVFYSVIIPLFEGPDEDDHFRYAKFIADHRALPVQLFEPGGGAAGHQGWQPPLYYSLVALLISPLDTADLDEHLLRNPNATFIGDPACCGRNIYYHTGNEAFPWTRTTLAVHLARLLSVLFGAITVGATYELATVFLTGSRLSSKTPSGDWVPFLPLAAAAVVAFNPSFLFASALVSNDTLLAAFASLALLTWAKWLVGQQAPSRKSAVLLGCCIGLGVLTKTTALGLIPFSVIAFGIAAARQRDYRLAVGGAALMITACAVISGWWFARSQVLYGDPLAYRLMTISALFPRSGPLTLPELFQISLPWLWQTLWGGPTPGDIAPLILVLLGVCTALACVGMAAFVIQHRSLSTWAILALLVGWLGSIVIAQIRFIQMTVGADQGRYLFPAIPVLGLILGVGMSTLAIARLPARVTTAAIVVGFFSLAVWVPAAYTLPAYGRPALLAPDAMPTMQHRVNVAFGDQLVLLGYDLDGRTVKAGDVLHVTLYWRALTAMPESYRVFVHLIGQNDASAGGADVVPGRGAFPTLYWRPGDTLRDTVEIPIASDAQPGRYVLEVGLYSVSNPSARVNISGSHDDRAVIDALKVAAPATVAYAPRSQVNAVFGERAKLVGYDAEIGSNSLRLVLYWEDIAPFERDYTVFVHALSADGTRVAQIDQEPQGGNNPTSLWAVGEQVRDEYILQIDAASVDQIALGMYRLDTGERLAVRSSAGEADHLVLKIPGAAQ